MMMPIDYGRLALAFFYAPQSAAREYWKVIARAMR